MDAENLSSYSKMMAHVSPLCLGNIPGEANSFDSLMFLPTFQHSFGGEDTESPRSSGGTTKNVEVKEVKKLNHNANERHRRKRINSLYSSLRSLLPTADQPKKLSIPATVSRVVKYIPELQKEVEALIEKKERNLRHISQGKNSSHLGKKMKLDAQMSVVSATRICEKEIMIQVSIFKSNRVSFAQIVLHLEQNGLLLLNSSVFESSEARVFYNFHLQVEGTHQVQDLEGLKQKLLSLLEKQQDQPLLPNFPSNDFITELF